MIDCHIHLQSGDLPPNMFAEGDRLGVRLFVGSCLGIATDWPLYPTLDELTAFNDAMAAVCRRHPDRVKGYCYANPRLGAPMLDQFRRRIEDDAMVGLKLWVATLCTDPLVFPLIEQAIEYRAPILVHTWRKTIDQLPHESTAGHVADLARRYPEARIIMAHLGGQAESALNQVAPYPNVYTDPSGTPIGAAEVALAAERLGPERVLFGSDLPIGCLAVNIGKILAADRSPAETAQMLGGNMAKLLAEVAR